MTLMSSHNSDGCTGRCDAKYYNAVSEHCDCMCGGVNHGVGLKKAMSNTQEIGEKLLDDYCEKKGIDRKTVFVEKKVFQLSMFE